MKRMKNKMCEIDLFVMDNLKKKNVEAVYTSDGYYHSVVGVSFNVFKSDMNIYLQVKRLFGCWVIPSFTGHRKRQCTTPLSPEMLPLYGRASMVADSRMYIMHFSLCC